MADLEQLLASNPPGTCQWLDGEPRERNFCGELVQAGSSYCPEHHTRCYQKAPEDEEAKGEAA